MVDFVGSGVYPYACYPTADIPLYYRRGLYSNCRRARELIRSLGTYECASDSAETDAKVLQILMKIFFVVQTNAQVYNFSPGLTPQLLVDIAAIARTLIESINERTGDGSCADQRDAETITLSSDGDGPDDGDILIIEEESH